MGKGKKEPIVTGGDIQARIKLAIAQTEKDFGIGTVSILGKGVKAVPLPRSDSGSHYLNDLLGGGWATGRIYEVFGPESSGKTTIALHAVAEAQKEDLEKIALYVDTEHALDVGYAQSLGVDLSRLILVQPDTGEDAFQIIELFLEQDCISIYVIDSVAAMIPKAELEGEIGDNHMATLARLMSMTIKKINRLTHRTMSIGIFINQIREKVGVMFGNPETTPGGRALKFYASARIDIRPTGMVKKDDNPYIRETKIKIVKSKISTPFREASVDIEFGKGISRSGEIIDIGCDHGLIAKTGAWFAYKELRAQGREKMKALIEENPLIMDELNQIISLMMMPSEDEIIVEEPELGDMPEILEEVGDVE